MSRRAPPPLKLLPPARRRAAKRRAREEGAELAAVLLDSLVVVNHALSLAGLLEGDEAIAKQYERVLERVALGARRSGVGALGRALLEARTLDEAVARAEGRR
jgi:hypothetical protein